MSEVVFTNEISARRNDGPVKNGLLHSEPATLHGWKTAVFAVVLPGVSKLVGTYVTAPATAVLFVVSML